MPRMQLHYHCEFDDREEFTVIADQRDWAAMEGADLPERGPVARARYMAWHAAHRIKVFAGDWLLFCETCVEVTDVSPEDGEDEQGDNPGMPATSAGSTSPSPARLANRSRKS